MINSTGNKCLTGKHDVYSFSPNNKKFILKNKGELNSSYIGYCQSTNIKVVIKRLNPDLLLNSNALERFAREDSVTKAIKPDSFLSEIVHDKDEIYFVRKYIEGNSVKNLLSGKYRKKVSLLFSLKCLTSALESLSQLHRKGIIHCDIKPENIIVENKENSFLPDWENPKVHLIDFGLSRFLNQNENDNKTKLPFSLIYGAPEQMLNFRELIGPSTDFFSLLVTFYSMLIKKNPYSETNPLKLIQIQLISPLQYKSSIPKNLFFLIEKATAKPRIVKPPRLYTRSELFTLVNNAQFIRFQNDIELMCELETIIKELTLEKKNFFSKIYSRFS